MNPSLARTVDVEDVSDFDARVASGATSMYGWHFQSVDLRDRSNELVRLGGSGAIFLGCTFAKGIGDLLRSRGALLFPPLPNIPFSPYRGHLYTGLELYAGIDSGEYECVHDALIYQWTLQNADGQALTATLAASMHDHAMSDALDEFIATSRQTGTRMVGVMGGHACQRGCEDYVQAAKLGRALAREGFLVTTGGGPGAMEAANLGAYLCTYDDDALESALATLGAVPNFQPSITAWARAAAQVVARYPAASENLGIPTWFYGHEPPNMFATRIAKYFANSIREAVLLSRCDGGIVFLPGTAGTVQEIFQDACENYYAAQGAVRPMILVGRKQWEEELPLMPLLRTMSAGRSMEEHVHLVDTVEEACALIESLAN